MRYPCDYETETTVSIDAYDLVDYVRENWEFFKEKCESPYNNKMDIAELCTYARDALDKFDDVRRLRDSSHEHDTDSKVLLYNHLVEIHNNLEKLAN